MIEFHFFSSLILVILENYYKRPMQLFSNYIVRWHALTKII